MADKPVAKVGLAFEVPVTSMGADAVRLAVEELRNRLLAYAEVILRERNVLCQDVYVSQPGSALFTLTAANTTETRLKAVADKGNGHVAKPPKLEDADAKPKAKAGKASKAKDPVVAAEPPKEDPEDPPHIVMEPMEKKPEAAAPLATTAQWIEKAMVHAGKRTPKTLSLLTALIEANGELSPEEIAKAAKGDYSNLDVSSWLGQCLKKKNPYIARGQRGKYRFVKEG